MTETKTRRRRPSAEEPETPAGEPTPEEQEGEETEEQTQPDPELDPAEVQARKIDNAQRRYRRDLEGIVGDLSDAAECQLCGGLGFVDAHGSPRVHPDTERCDKCGGFGQLVTGSRAPGHEQIGCDKCGGTGHVRKLPTPSAQTESATVVQMPLPPQQVHGWWDPATSTFHPYGEAAPS